jgi:hypothetical protein
MLILPQCGLLCIPCLAFCLNLIHCCRIASRTHSRQRSSETRVYTYMGVSHSQSSSCSRSLSFFASFNFRSSSSACKAASLEWPVAAFFTLPTLPTFCITHALCKLAILNSRACLHVAGRCLCGYAKANGYVNERVMCASLAHFFHVESPGDKGNKG